MNEQELIPFIKYDTLTDKILWFSQYHSLNMNVRLANDSKKDGTRISAIKEYEYDSKYTNENKAYSMKRAYDYYLTIENITKTVYIQIRVQNMMMLKSVIGKMVNQLVDNSLWKIQNEQLQFTPGSKPEYLNNLVMNKWISFECVSMIYPNEEYGRGVRITLSNYEEFVDVSMDTFMAFVYIINSFDMVTYAATMINFINSNDVRGINVIRKQNDRPAASFHKETSKALNKSYFG